jgi:hypothetical protein
MSDAVLSIDVEGDHAECRFNTVSSAPFRQPDSLTCTADLSATPRKIKFAQLLSRRQRTLVLDKN